MNVDYISGVIKNYKEMEDAVSESVKISYGEATRITVENLIKRYKACNDNGGKQHLKYVLVNWYLTEEEFSKMIKGKENDSINAI